MLVSVTNITNTWTQSSVFSFNMKRVFLLLFTSYLKLQKVNNRSYNIAESGNPAQISARAGAEFQ